jgi:predicted small lipoprotein YifL
MFNFHKLIILMLLAAVVGFYGCGKKAPPVAPQAKPTPAVDDLQGHREGHRAVLAWHLPADWDHQAVELGGFRVYRYRRSLHAETCPGCPLVFEQVATIPLVGTSKTGAGDLPLQFVETIEPGYRYIYKVIGLGPTAMESGSSNLVEIVY